MNTVNEFSLNFVKTEFKTYDSEFTLKQNGREGVDFLVGINEIYLQSIDLDTSQRSIKIAKQELGELKDNLFVAIVVVLEKEPKVAYMIPSKDLKQSDSNIFTENEIALMPSLSNWEIRVATNTIPQLAKYALENMVNKLKS
jgi:hypothetical protein